MTPDPTAISPLLPVSQARELMTTLQCRHLPVVEDGRLVGIVSSKDVARPGETVRDIMSKGVETVRPTDSIEMAAATMAVRKISSLPVVDGDRVVGIVTTYDMLDALARRVRGER